MFVTGNANRLWARAIGSAFSRDEIEGGFRHQFRAVLEEARPMPHELMDTAEFYDNKRESLDDLDGRRNGGLGSGAGAR